MSRSPELFYRVDAGGVISTRPMKGTVPRGKTEAEDAELKAFLGSDEKNRTENLMIVDLLRNDISRVAELGSVKVPELFTMESYATVHQMTSPVQAQMRKGVSIAEMFTALFPCGSITGAPKIRAMEVINDLEDAARDIYCGSIGVINAHLRPVKSLDSASDPGYADRGRYRSTACDPPSRWQRR